MKKSVRCDLLVCDIMGQEHLRNTALIEGEKVVAITESDEQMRQHCTALVPNVLFLNH